MELEHFSHPHPLTFKEEKENNEEKVVCFGCEEPISGHCYNCWSCNFFLCKNCAELPQEIMRHFHSEHSLLLLAKPPSYYKGACCCDICNKTCNSFVYHCSLCKFDLDIKCAFPPCLFEVDSHGHQFRSVIPLKSLPFTCNACGVDGDDSPFMCNMCQLMVHRKCISLPQTIRTVMHHHLPIVHTYSLGQEESVKQYCGICREEVKAGFGHYYCPHCEYVAHAICAKRFRGTGSSEEEELGATINDGLKELASYYTVREIRQGNDIVVAEIKHFSHQHNLILMNEFNHDLKCDGCRLPIFSPCYSCAECNFFLDKSCIELPRTRKLLHHPHPVTLRSKTRKRDGTLICSACRQYCHGFVYRCGECSVSFDVRCMDLVKDFIEHEGHEHPLFLAWGIKDSHCNACGVSGKYVFRCIDCGFNLDFRCATLPREVRHTYEEHPLLLTYIDPNTYQYYCQICEKERNPKFWLYRCEKCDFDAHPECVLGKNPYIKFGGTYLYSFHSQPLALVEKTEGDLTCHTCGDPCNDLALECTDSHCKFIVHRKRKGCMPLLE